MEDHEAKKIVARTRRELKNVAIANGGHYEKDTVVGMKDGLEWSAQFNQASLSNRTQTLAFYINGQRCSGSNLNEAIEAYHRFQAVPDECDDCRPGEPCGVCAYRPASTGTRS